MSSKKIEISREIELPSGVTATFSNSMLVIKGPEGEVSRKVNSRGYSFKIEENNMVIKSVRATKENKKVTGSLVAHIKNMIRGSQKKHQYTLKICSGHFPMNVSIAGGKLTIKNFLGEKVPRTLNLKHHTEVKIEGDLIHVSSSSKELAGQVSADIEQLTRRPGFDTRVFQDGIYIIVKDGRSLK